MNTDSTSRLLEVTGERSLRSIALKAGYDPSTLTRQVKAGIKAETLIDIARACDIPVVATLVAFGFITEAEALAVKAGNALANATDEQLAQEILDRVKSPNPSRALTAPIDEVANVSGQPEDDLPHVGKVDVDKLRQDGVALAADERDGVEEEQEQSQELP